MAATDEGVSPSEPPPEEDKRIKRTMADLDSLLGLIDDKPSSKATTTYNSSSSSSTDQPAPTSISIAPGVLKKMADAEAQRLSQGDTDKAGPIKDDIEDQFQKIITKARKLASDQQAAAKAPGAGGAPNNTEAESTQLRQEFETLLKTLSKKPDILEKDDLKKLKEAAFGPLTFWVTETPPIIDKDSNQQTGVMIRGNLRDEREKVYELVQAKVSDRGGGRGQAEVGANLAEPQSAVGPSHPTRMARMCLISHLT